MNMPKGRPQPIDTPDWVISDTHFCHGNIRVYEEWRKSWSDGTSHMNRAMVEEWNKVVGPDDLVLHMGDFALGKKEVIARLLRKLNGRVIIVRGNHDPSHKAMVESGFCSSYNAVEFTYEGQLYVVRHSPHDFTEEDTRRADILLHGHLHGSGNYNMSRQEVNDAVKVGRCIDLSLDAIERVSPVTLKEVKEMHGH